MQGTPGAALGGDAETVRRFLAERYLFDPNAQVDPRASLLGEGVLDSTGAMELVLFVEQSFEITIDDDELVPENLDSIERVVSLVARKRAAMRGSSAFTASESEAPRAAAR